MILAGKVAIVTGGGWNIGRAVALRFAREGARVAIAGRREELLASVAEEIRAAGGAALPVPTDVTDRAAVAALAAETRAALGSVDVLAALAGGGGTSDPVEEVDPLRWEEIVRVNLFGTFLAVRAVLPAMKERRSGTIVTCAGGGTCFPIQGAHATAYASAKAAIARFTDQLAVECLASGVRVNCLLPGPTWSPDELRAVEEEERRSAAPHPGRRENRPPEESAELAAWLASDESAPLSGRIVAAGESWWREPARVRAVQASLHACCLRRVDPPAQP